MQSRADVREQTDSVWRNCGGGCATRRGTERATEIEKRWVGCTHGANPILSIAAIVASNPGDLVRGASGVDSTDASRFLTTSATRRSSLYEKRFSYKNYRKGNDPVKR
jgi:hypothetical protein